MAEDSGTLIEAIAKAVPRAHTQALDISFNELLDMRKNGELNISPDFSGFLDGVPVSDLDLLRVCC